MKKNLLSIIAIAFSLIAVGFAIFRITPFEIVNDTYIGAIATLIGVFVTLHIGFQIYNGLELRKEVAKQTRVFRIEIAKQKKKSEELDKLIVEQQETSEIQNHKMEEYFSITTAFIIFQDKNHPSGIGAFRFMHKALISSLQINSPKNTLIFNNLRTYILIIDKGYLNSKFKHIADGYLINIDKDEETIRQHPNFGSIKMEYNSVMKSYRKRIAEIKENPERQLTQVEKEAIINS